MATFRQVEANRRNALKSTGPASPEGKAVSRFNALKTGIHAQSQVIPGEDPAELEELAENYHRQFPPATPLERFLVDSLVNADWQLRRLHRLEAQLWANQIDENGDLGQVYRRGLDVFTRLQRRIDAAERSFYRGLRELERLRAAEPASDLPEPAPDPYPPVAAPAPDLASFCDIPEALPPPAA